MTESLRNEINFYKELAEEIKPDGFKSFLYAESGSAWMYVITPGNSWLYIDRAEWGGFNISFEYKPSAGCGSGCRCNDNPLFEITASTLLDAEKYGKNFRWNNCGHMCKPALYTDAMKAMESSYFSEKLTEL